jgi:hypothetical protein
MANKNKQKAENNNSAATAETWRKPLQVPPRANAMRSFYQGAKEDLNPPVEEDDRDAALAEENVKPSKIKTQNTSQSPPEAANREKVKPQTTIKMLAENSESKNNLESSSVAAVTATGANKLTKEDLVQKLGIEIDDLFDVHELLRGKSFDIYQALIESADENGRCKITQPELMKRTGIKNRRTFYKHEDWLIGLKLLEKRHLPGDHKGVVYRVLEISDVLPVSNAMLEKFKNRLKNAE